MNKTIDLDNLKEYIDSDYNFRCCENASIITRELYTLEDDNICLLDNMFWCYHNQQYIENGNIRDLYIVIPNDKHLVQIKLSWNHTFSDRLDVNSYKNIEFDSSYIFLKIADGFSSYWLIKDFRKIDNKIVIKSENSKSKEDNIDEIILRRDNEIVYFYRTKQKEVIKSPSV